MIEAAIFVVLMFLSIFGLVAAAKWVAKFFSSKQDNPEEQVFKDNNELSR